MDLGLKDKVVICMSSASGFGKGIATEFAREGAKNLPKDQHVPESPAGSGALAPTGATTEVSP